MNKVTLIGRLTDNPDMRVTQQNNGENGYVTRFRLAVDRKYKKQGENDADFIPCVCFGKTAENIAKFFTKGRKIAVIGRIQTGSYTNKDGQKVYTTDIVVEEFDFCDSKPQQEQQAEQTPPPVQNDFVDVPEGIENELPFK